jgi:hypothetical protein
MTGKLAQKDASLTTGRAYRNDADFWLTSKSDHKPKWGSTPRRTNSISKLQFDWDSESILGLFWRSRSRLWESDILSLMRRNSWLYHLNTWRGLQTMKTPTLQFSTVSSQFPPAGTSTSISTLFSKTRNLCAYVNDTGQASRPQKTTENITTLYSCIPQSVWRQLNSIFQSELPTKFDPMFRFLTSSILSFL